MKLKPLTKFKIKSIEYFDTLFKTVNLTWNCSRKYAALSILINILLGLYTPVSLWVWSRFIDSVVRAINGDEISMPIFFLLFYCIFAIIAHITGLLGNLVEETQRDYLNKYITEILLNKTSILELYHFDNPKCTTK